MVLFGISHSYRLCTAQQGPWIKARRQSILILLSQRSHSQSPDSGQAEHRGRPSRGRPCLERWRRGLCGGRPGNRGRSNSWAAPPALGQNSEGIRNFKLDEFYRQTGLFFNRTSSSNQISFSIFFNAFRTFRGLIAP